MGVSITEQKQGMATFNCKKERKWRSNTLADTKGNADYINKTHSIKA